MTIDKTLYGIPSDPHRASQVAMRDAQRVRDLWRQHGFTRRLTDRQELAERAAFYEEQVRRIADHLEALSAFFSGPQRIKAHQPILDDGAHPARLMSDLQGNNASDANYRSST